MAKPTLINAKAQAAIIANALNAALHDTILPGIFPEWDRPDHAMRDWSKYVKMSDFGNFTANDDYLDAAYVGKKRGEAYSEKDDRVTKNPV